MATAGKGNGRPAVRAEPDTGAADGDRGPVTAGRILAVFRAMGLHNTRPRRLIAQHLAALSTGSSDFTADDLWHDLQQLDGHVARATVYRAVDVLLSQGVLDRIPFADGSHRYRLCGASHHHHVTCNRCHRVVEVSMCLPADLLVAIERKTAFALEGHSIELFGRCADCQVAEQAGAAG